MMRKQIVSMTCGGLLAAFLLSAGGTALAKPSTKERVTSLEAEVAELKVKSAGALDTADRLYQLEDQIRSLTGQVETLTYQLQEADAKINSLSAALAGDSLPLDADGPFSTRAPTDLSGPVELGGHSPLGAAGDDPIAGQIARSGGDLPPPPVNDVQLPLDSEAAYAYANGFALQGDMPRAEAALTLFLDAFGSNPRAADAQFRLGEVYLAQRKYADAADTFVDYVRKYPSDGRAAEAYLKLGASFSGLGQREEACKVLKAVKSRYPGAGAQVLTRADRELQRNNCR